MSNKVNYRKIKDLDSINLHLLDINKYQCYMPILEKLFILNDTNYNKIILNSNFYLKKILDKKTYHLYKCIIGNEVINEYKQDIYFKYSPLFDPIKYTIGKINDLSYNHKILPKYNCSEGFSYINDFNNIAYVDGLFTYISSILFNNYGFINGINFYGSFLALKNNFIYNIYDELDVVIDNKEFINNIDKLFTIDSSFNTFIDIYNNNNNNNNNDDKKPPISILTSNNDDDTSNILDIHDISNECEIKIIDEETNMKNDIAYKIDEFILNKISHEDSVELDKNDNDDSSCSSRSSNTILSENNLNLDDMSVELDKQDDDEDDEDDDDDEEDEDEDDDDDKVINIYLKDYPINVIAMEPLTGTLEELMNNDELNEHIWSSILLQVILTLVIYQDLFSFTHNDLHTSNIMYKETDKQYVCYCYNNIYYKIPTYGKIWKIIDFGRSIFTFKDKEYCSNSFCKDGDASTQYNFGPYYDEKKTKVLPNKSFDLCRLGCSLFDYFFDDIDETKDNDLDDIQKLVRNWCCDDKGRNVVYKQNGDERYPEFKLYKMISRTVHNHTPHSQLEKNIFKQYIVNKKSIKKLKVINIDEIIKNVTNK